MWVLIFLNGKCPNKLNFTTFYKMEAGVTQYVYVFWGLMVRSTQCLQKIIISNNSNMRVIHLIESRWPNEFDQTMTTMNLNNWTWPKLKPTNLMKPTNRNFTSGVLLISMPNVFFHVEERRDGASEAGQLFQPVRACKLGAWEPVQADCTSIFFWDQLNVCRCCEFRSSSKNEVRHCENFLVMF